MPNVLRRPSRTSQGSEGTNQRALMYRVSDQDGAAEAGRPRTGRTSHGAKKQSGLAAMSGNGMMDRGPEHLRQPPDGNGTPEHGQQALTAR